MGKRMAGHVLNSKKFDEVWVFDINKAAPKDAGIGVIDAPVCFGLDGARNGKLGSMVGG
jgi:3-hydroxyisobutyrate dehydrogenase-like beta-hydroxyacid dehydrogenase